MFLQCCIQFQIETTLLNISWYVDSDTMSVEKDVEKIYRPSATLIIAAKSDSKDHGYNYRILLAKRSPAIAFAPDHYVFPGGTFDFNGDDSIEWLNYFHLFGLTDDDLEKLSLLHLPHRPSPLMTNGSSLKRDISLRITAIREAFEEVGILLCLNHEELEVKPKSTGTLKYNFDRLYWQQKVHNNAKEFLNLCKYLDVIPDLWSLYEWSIWRSPPAARKKYDTVIYMVALEEQPQLLLELSEVEEALWTTPLVALKLFKNRSIWLAPLQFYEISRLSSALDWFYLLEFVKKRSSNGSTLIMLAYYRCSDYLVGLLPGDDYYPKDTLDHKNTIQMTCTSAEFTGNTKNIHRLIYRDIYDLYVTANIPSIDGHLTPILHSSDYSKL